MALLARGTELQWYSHVMYVWENTRDIVDICTFFHAINNLVLFRLKQPANWQDMTAIN